MRRTESAIAAVKRQAVCFRPYEPVRASERRLGVAPGSQWGGVK